MCVIISRERCGRKYNVGIYTEVHLSFFRLQPISQSLIPILKYCIHICVSFISGNIKLNRQRLNVTIQNKSNKTIFLFIVNVKSVSHSICKIENEIKHCITILLRGITFGTFILAGAILANSSFHFFQCFECTLMKKKIVLVYGIISSFCVCVCVLNETNERHVFQFKRNE